MKQVAQHHPHVSLASSVRTRLTLWYLAVMAFLVVCFGVSFYVTQAFLIPQANTSQLDTQLYQESNHFAGIYKQALLAHQQLSSLKLYRSSVQEMVLLLNPAGNVLDARGPLTGSLTQQLEARAEQHLSLFELTIASNQRH